MPVWMESFSFGDQGPSGPPREDRTGAFHDLEARRRFLVAAEPHHSQNSLPAVDDVEDRNSATGLEALTGPHDESSDLMGGEVLSDAAHGDGVEIAVHYFPHVLGGPVKEGDIRVSKVRSSLGEHRGRAFNADALTEVGGVVGDQLAGSATDVEKPVTASKMQKFLSALLGDPLGRLVRVSVVGLVRPVFLPIHARILHSGAPRPPAASRGPGPDRELASPLRHRKVTLVARIATTRAGRHLAASPWPALRFAPVGPRAGQSGRTLKLSNWYRFTGQSTTTPGRNGECTLWPLTETTCRGRP